MKLSENTIREIADWLQCGFECWIHKVTGTIYFFPSPEDAYFDPTQWEDDLADIQRNEQDYVVFQTMDSSHSFRIMENFVFSLSESMIKSKLNFALSGARPFYHFNMRVRNSQLNEAWANFKFDAHKDWVKSQVDCFEIVS